MQQVLVTTCACKYTGHPFTQKMHIVTLELPVREREVEVCATIVDAIPDIPLDIDNRISQVFPLLFTPEDLLPLLDVVALWTQGEGGIRYAIEQQFKKDWQSAVTQPIQFRFGTHFIASVNDSRLDTDEVVLTKIARIVAAIIANKATEVNCDLRQLRASRTADSPQRTRTSDGAEAWRLTLTKHGVGWRMHYWRIPGPDGGIIEFANVLKKHDPEEIC